MRDKETVRFHYLSKVLDTSVICIWWKKNVYFEKTGYNETWTVINSPGNSIISEIQ